MEVQLLHQVGPVSLHGFHADAELIGNLLVFVSLPNQFENLSLPLGDCSPQ
jgi:hypothetical protein